MANMPYAVRYVTDAHNTFLHGAKNMMANASALVGAMGTFTVTPTAISAPQVGGGPGGGFNRPTKPSLTENFAFNIPAAPPLPPNFAPGSVSLPSLPDFNMAPPTFNYGTRPAPPNIAAPIAPARVPLPNMPAEPNWERPQPVTLESLNLPQMPNIELPTYTARVPAPPEFNVVDNFSRFTPEEYVSQLLGKLEIRVSTWLKGEEALPAAIEHALFGRGRTRVEAERAALEQQAYDDFAARGFSAPNGVLTARLDAIRQDAQNKTAEFNRDAMLKSFDEALANMRLAVQQGIQLEGTKINLHLEEQRLELQSLTHLRDTAIAVLNARVSFYNAQLQFAQIEAQLFDTRLKAELSKLEVMRAQVEMEKLKGDVNQQKVDIYKAQWDAVRTMASWYGERVNAYQAAMEAAKLPIEIFAKEVDAFEAMYGAYGQQVQAYRAEMEGEQAKATLYKASADAYAARVQGIAAIGGLHNDRERMRIQQHGQVLEQYGLQLRRVDQMISAEQARLQAAIQVDNNRLAAYRTEADVEQAASAAFDRIHSTNMATLNANAQLFVEAARANAQQSAALQALQLEALKAQAQVMSQLAASSMSAVNYSASISSGWSSGSSRSVSWSGEAGDWNPGHTPL